VAPDSINTVVLPANGSGNPEFVSHQLPIVGEPRKYTPGAVLKSQRAYFADALSAVLRADYKGAVERFGEMMDHYNMPTEAMPYLAYAVGKTGDSLPKAMRIPDLDRYRDRDFDSRLVRALLAGARKDLPEARKWLGLAQRVRPNPDDRVVMPEFQYAQACEWLFRDTQDDAFRTMLLDWVRAYQTIQPTLGWAYAVQYSYEKDPAERVRALAMTRYLDPSSPRIAGAPAAEVQKAKAWWKDHNPFAIPARSSARPPV